MQINYPNKFNTNITLIILSGLISLIFFSCNQKNEAVPYAYVNFSISLSDPQFSDLKVPGNSISVRGGVKGIILYCDDINSYKAYDRYCTYRDSTHNSNINCRVTPENKSSTFAICNCCGSHYLLPANGFPTDISKAVNKLKEYQTSSDGFKLYVSN